ncbi:MAG: toprim domain-containing protein [Acidimicrobiales bacterium]
MKRPSPIEAAKARHGLAEVARRTGIPLPYGRGSLTVRCPMPAHGHPDRSPSLRLYLDDGLWCCLACSPRKPDGNPRAGDVIEWVCQTEGVEWPEAIELLDSGTALTNAWAGAIPESRPTPDRRSADAGHQVACEPVGQAEHPDLGRTPPERVQEALEEACRYYTLGLLHDRGVAYLAGRGIDVTVLEAHNQRLEVGHTPGRATGLVEHLRSRGFSDDELVDAGVALRRLGGGPVSDFYRQRVLIPLHDPDGRLAGLIGRNVGDPRWPKYKNPPRTHRYDKAVNLYQPLPAPADRDGQVVVVEGTLDAMAIAVAAIRAGVASRFCPVTQSGRELSNRQLDHVLGLHPSPPVIAFDGDGPGRESSVRVAQAATQQGRKVVLAALPDGEDPASWLAAHGPAGIADLVRPQPSVFGNDGARRVRSVPVVAATHAGHRQRAPRGSNRGAVVDNSVTPIASTEVQALEAI